MSTPPLLLIVAAASGCGKTTLLERVLPELRARGVRAAVVKMTHHDVDLDTPGKDTHRLRSAGAVPTLLAGPALVTHFSPTPEGGIAALARLAAAGGDVDVVLVEGGKHELAHPRIEVVPPGGVLVTTDAATLVAVVGEATTEAPRFARDDAIGVAAHIERWLRARLTARPA